MTSDLKAAYTVCHSRYLALLRQTNPQAKSEATQLAVLIEYIAHHA